MQAQPNAIGSIKQVCITSKVSKSSISIKQDIGFYLHQEGPNLGKTLCPLSPVTIRLDAQFGTPYPRSAGFNTDKDHPSRTAVVGCLPLLVSPTIRNLKVTKMLVDSGAKLNLISPAVVVKSSLVTPFLFPLHMPSSPCLVLLQCSSLLSMPGPSFVRKTNVSNLGSIIFS